MESEEITKLVDGIYKVSVSRSPCVRLSFGVMSILTLEALENLPSFSWYYIKYDYFDNSTKSFFL